MANKKECLEKAVGQLKVSKEIEERYEIKQECTQRHAVVIFKAGKFSGCAYYGVGGQYTLDDWRFIIELGKKILDIAKCKGAQ